MTIATLTDYATAVRFRGQFDKVPSGNSPNPQMWMTMWNGTGTPGAGAASGNTTTGIVPTRATTGALAFPDFTGMDVRVGSIEMQVSHYPMRFMLYDRVFHVGNFTSNTTFTLSSQPSYSGRVPNGTDYAGLQIWMEQLADPGASPTLTVTYTDQSGNAGHTTGAIVFANGANRPVTPQIAMMPLAAGDCGVQVIESVTVSGLGGSGVTGIFVARPLFMVSLNDKNESSGMSPVIFPIDTVGLPEIFPDSCLSWMFKPPTSVTGQFLHADVEIVAK